MRANSVVLLIGALFMAGCSAGGYVRVGMPGDYIASALRPEHEVLALQNGYLEVVDTVPRNVQEAFRERYGFAPSHYFNCKARQGDFEILIRPKGIKWGEHVRLLYEWTEKGGRRGEAGVRYDEGLAGWGFWVHPLHTGDDRFVKITMVGLDPISGEPTRTHPVVFYIWFHMSNSVTDQWKHRSDAAFARVLGR